MQPFLNANFDRMPNDILPISSENDQEVAPMPLHGEGKRAREGRMAPYSINGGNDGDGFNDRD